MSNTPTRPAGASHRVGRRRLLQIGGAGALGALAVPLLTACGNDETENNVDVSNSGPGVTVTVPNFTPISSATPAPSATATQAAANTPPPGGKVVTVEMTDDLKFKPDSVTIARGTTITWNNTSTVIHTSTGDAAKAIKKQDAVLPQGAQPWDSGFMSPGKQFSHTFDVPGSYTYFCIPHELQGMIGHVTVQG